MNSVGKNVCQKYLNTIAIPNKLHLITFFKFIVLDNQKLGILRIASLYKYKNVILFNYSLNHVLKQLILLKLAYKLLMDEKEAYLYFEGFISSGIHYKRFFFFLIHILSHKTEIQTPKILSPMEGFTDILAINF